MMKIKTQGNARPMMNDPGHTSLVSDAEYKFIIDGAQKVVFAGELQFDKKGLRKWTARSGHFLPDASEENREIFGKKWGLDKIPYQRWQDWEYEDLPRPFQIDPKQQHIES